MNLANKLESNEIATPSVEKDVEYSVNRPHCHNLELELMTEWEVPLSDRYVRLSNSSTQQSPEPKICGNKSPKSVKEVFNPITSPGMCHLLDSYSEATDSQGRSGSACSTVASVAEAPSIILKFRAIRFGTYNNLKPEALTLTQDNVVANLPVTTDGKKN